MNSIALAFAVILPMVARTSSAAPMFLTVVRTRQPSDEASAQTFLSGARKLAEQLLRLGDFRHFRCRRKPFQRGREDGVGFGKATGAL